MRNNRFCPVCKRRVLPGGSDSESSDESTGNATVSNTSSSINRRNSLTENQPNEEDDTNESTRLLINVRSNSNDDNISSVTLNTNLANNPSQTNDMSSLNNQMTTSVSSSQMLNQANNKDCLRSSSSRYGSITSVNNVTAAVATTSKLADDQSDFICEIKKIKDSKATPEDDVYFTPVTDSSAVNFKVVSDMKEKKLKKKIVKKSNSSNQITKNEQSVRIENESIASSSSASFTANQENDTAALLLSSRATSRSLSPSSRKNNNNNKLSHDSKSAQDKTNEHTNDNNSKIV